VSRIAVVGAGSWGTALAVHLGRIGHDVRLWGRDPDLVCELQKRRANAVYLPGINFPESLRPVASLDEALDDVRAIVLAVPSHGLRQILQRAAPVVSSNALVVSATKGLEELSKLRMSELVQLELPGTREIVVLPNMCCRSSDPAHSVYTAAPMLLVWRSVDR
jgi:glycerol-3-phosphate dehydrogenase (NAD(P)+)